MGGRFSSMAWRLCLINLRKTLCSKQLSGHFINRAGKKEDATHSWGPGNEDEKPVVKLVQFFLLDDSSSSHCGRCSTTNYPSTWVLEAGGGTMRAASPSNHVGGSWRCKCKLWPQHVHFGYYAMICHNMASKATIGVGEYIAMLDNVATKHTWHCNLQGGVTHGKDNRFMLFFQVLQSSGLCMWKSHVISQ